MTNARRTVVAAALGECVHVAGVMNFLRLAEAAGWRTVFLGPAVSSAEVVDAVEAVVETYVAARRPGERFLETYRRVGAAPFKERVYAAA